MGAAGVDTGRIQILAIVGSLAALALVGRLLVRRRLREEVALLALGIALVFLVLATWRPLLEKLAFAVGIAYPPAALLLIMASGAYAMMLHHAIVLTRLEDRQRTLVQEVALLRLELEHLRPVTPPPATAGVPSEQA
ncbi:MAG: DUF2304 domain-containing protein [Candidatus Sericytochromatia bacterium]|nr:DUF2304 domain-containing protein [Candidatus Sericytochromatia bacterium]